MTEQRSPEQQADAWSVPRRLGYLGPAGTFTQQALRSWLASASPSAYPSGSSSDRAAVWRAIRSAAMIPPCRRA